MQTTDPNIILDIQNLSCGYGGKPVVEDFSLQVGKGDRIAIVGPNGCGKSTLLRAIYQLCVINSGTITYKGHLLNGKTPEQVKRLGVAWFMQKNSVFPKLSVIENLVLSLNRKNSREKAIEIENIISIFPVLKIWLEKTAGLLSGGERQLLAMAMLVAQEADLWLLDEPTAGLDAERSAFFLELIIKHGRTMKKNPKTILFIEHKSAIIHQLSTRIINLKM